MLRANLKWKLVVRCWGSCLAIMLAIVMTSCEQSTAIAPNFSANPPNNHALATTDGPLSEVNVPISIAKLAPSLEKFQPQVQILSPQPDQILTDDRAIVQLQVSDLPIFKNPELGLGNHLHVILDKQTYKGVYDLTQPLVFENLAAGTHTLRVFAERPWHESFKNEGAYAQTTFHVLTKTAENNPNPQQPLLTYSRPAGSYGAEPIMLDYYLTNAPSHLVANGSSDSLPDWRIRATVNNQQFIIDRWTPVYLQGFKQGKNWVRLELVDDRGNPISNVYNDTVSIVTYDPQAKDTLAKLVRGEINPNLARTLVDPQSVVARSTPAPAPVVLPTPVTEPTPIVTPSPQPIAIPSPVIVPSPQPIAIPSPVIVPSPPPTAIPSPIVVAPPQPIAIPSPIVVPPPPQPIAIPSPIVVASPPQPTAIPSPIVVAPPQPIAISSPSTSQVPNQNPIEIVQPKILPSPLPTPIAGNPQPLPLAQPAPPVAPDPATVKTPVNSVPAAMPEPIGSPFVPATSIPRKPATPKPQPTGFAPSAATPTSGSPAVLSPQNPVAVEIPPQSTPQLADRGQKTWQDRAIELIQIAGVKTRAFTHTIPGKAQRFGHNVHIWFGKAIDTIQSWRNQGPNE